MANEDDFITLHKGGNSWVVERDMLKREADENYCKKQAEELKKLDEDIAKSFNEAQERRILAKIEKKSAELKEFKKQFKKNDAIQSDIKKLTDEISRLKKKLN